MAYITNKERESLIKKINKSYALRKILMIIEMVLLIGFIIVTFVSLVQSTNNADWAWWNNSTHKFTTLGAIMLAWAIVEGLLGIIVLVLILTLKSPKKVTQQITKLETSALSGKKVKRTQTSSEIFKTRTTVEEKKNKKGKK